MIKFVDHLPVFFYNVDTSGRAAQLYIPVYDGPASGENPVGTLGEVLYFIVPVHKGHIYRNRIQDGIDLLRGKTA